MSPENAIATVISWNFLFMTVHLFLFREPHLCYCWARYTNATAGKGDLLRQTACHEMCQRVKTAQCQTLPYWLCPHLGSLSSICANARMTQEELGLAVGYSRAHVARLES